MAYNRGHAHLIVFTHACVYYSNAATISFAELFVRLQFEGGVRLLFELIWYLHITSVVCSLACTTAVAALIDS